MRQVHKQFSDEAVKQYLTWCEDRVMSRLRFNRHWELKIVSFICY